MTRTLSWVAKPQNAREEKLSMSMMESLGEESFLRKASLMLSREPNRAVHLWSKIKVSKSFQKNFVNLHLTAFQMRIGGEEKSSPGLM